MAIFLSSIAVFTFVYTLLWLHELRTFDVVMARVSNAFDKKLFAEQQISERDRIFKLFPLEPSPILFGKISKAQDILEDQALRGSTKVLGGLLMSIAFGYLATTLADLSPSLLGINLLQLQLVIFGMTYFLTRTPSFLVFGSPTVQVPPAEKETTSSWLWLFFLTFAIVFPLLLASFEFGSNALPIITEAVDGAVEADPVPLGSDDRLFWFLKLLQVAALSIPVFLFFFSLSDARLKVEQGVFEDEDIALGSLTRIKNLASVLLAIVLALAVMKVDLSSLSLFSGLAAAGLSVAMRESITNFFSGLQMTWDRSLKIGDVISIPRGDSSDTGSTYGIVKDIRSRYTVVEDRNTVRRLVPNFQMVSQTIEHWTHEDKSVRLSLRIGIPYVEEPRQVRQAQRIMESVCYDVPRVLTHKPPNALLVKYGESQLTFSLRFWIQDAQNGIRPVISEVLISLYERLNDAGIRIPFPQQDIRIKELPSALLEPHRSEKLPTSDTGKDNNDEQ